MKIQFLGAAGGVTGSSYLLATKSGTFLIDLGMFQGLDDVDQINFAPLTFDVKNLNAVFLTHAHLDHCGRLPKLIQQGFQGQVYATEPTEMIAKIALLDSAHIASEGQPQVIYTKEEVNKICEKMEIVDYDRPFSIGNLTVVFRDAGHILGSGSIEISENNQTVIFSGDLGNTPQDLIQPTETIKRADFVVMESTYGDKTHPLEDVRAILQQEINAVEEKNGVLLIPAFSIERSQEVVHLISELLKSGQINESTQVFLDSPMAIEVTEIFKKFPKLYNRELSQELHPFDFPNLKMSESGQDSRAISKFKGTKIIIAGSGMMAGGRILHHLQNYVSNPSTHLLIVGYQAEGTLGRDIEQGAKKITIDNQTLPVNAQVKKIESLSSHADQPKLLNWLKNIQGVKKVFITHGEDGPRTVLEAKIKSDLGINYVTLPVKDQIMEL